MAKLPSAFNSDDYDDMNDFSCKPPGEYICTITDSDYVENSRRTGHYLKLEWTVQAGEHSGSKFWSNLNLDNPNQTAVEIAQKELATICRACGKVAIDDSMELHGIPVSLKIDIQKGKGDNPDRNIIRGYSPVSGSQKPSKKDDGDVKTTNKQSRRPIFEDGED